MNACQHIRNHSEPWLEDVGFSSYFWQFNSNITMVWWLILPASYLEIGWVPGSRVVNTDLLKSVRILLDHWEAATGFLRESTFSTASQTTATSARSSSNDMRTPWSSSPGNAVALPLRRASAISPPTPASSLWSRWTASLLSVPLPTRLPSPTTRELGSAPALSPHSGNVSMRVRSN